VEELVERCVKRCEELPVDNEASHWGFLDTVYKPLILKPKISLEWFASGFYIRILVAFTIMGFKNRIFPRISS
jgi:hypothetical protein